MKKLLLGFIMLLNFLVLGIASADYPDYLNGDRNCPIVGGHMGYGMYLVKNSIKIVSNNSDMCVLTFDTIGVPNADRGNVYNYNRTKVAYEYDKKLVKMYAGTGDKKRYIKPIGSSAETGHFFPGELAYYYAFGEKFYAAYTWKNSYTGQYEEPICAGVYKGLDLY